MKVFVHQGIVTAQAETEADITKLFSLKEQPVKRAYVLKQKHKKHKFKKECDVCHESFKGLKLHKRRAHRIADGSLGYSTPPSTNGWATLTVTKK